MNEPLLLRGPLLDLVDDPFQRPEAECLRYEPDGALLLDAGHIRARGPAVAMLARYPSLPVQQHRDQLLIPGFIDLHIHYPQTEMIAAYGEQLMTWLQRYTFPCEAQFQDPEHAARIAELFLDELLRHGTTTALVFATSSPVSVHAVFGAAAARDMRLLSGQTLMSRGAPEVLLNPPERALAQVREQIQRWHKHKRLLYAITPRFAVTSTREELALAGALWAEHPDLYVHTHLAENRVEIDLVARDFPEARDYLDVYDRAGLVGPRSVFAHSIHLDERAWSRLHQAGSCVAFCPSSNLFLGSGLFPLETALRPDRPVRVGLGTDVGGGTSFSLLRTMGEAYKVTQLQGQRLSPLRALHLATLGAARALGLEQKIGTLAEGSEADIVALDLRATPLMALRNGGAWPPSFDAVSDTLFAAMILGDERVVRQVWVAGVPQVVRVGELLTQPP